MRRTDEEQVGAAGCAPGGSADGRRPRRAATTRKATLRPPPPTSARRPRASPRRPRPRSRAPRRRPRASRPRSSPRPSPSPPRRRARRPRPPARPRARPRPVASSSRARQSRWSCCPSSWASPCSTRPTRARKEAADELSTTEAPSSPARPAENSVAGQIEIVTTAATQGVNALMLSNNAGDQIAPAARPRDAGVTVVTWDSPIPAPRARPLRRPGRLRRDRHGHGRHGAGHPGRRGRQVRRALGLARRRQPERLDRLARGGAADAKYASLELVDTVYGNDQSEETLQRRRWRSLDKYPDMKLIMAPTTVGIAAAAQGHDRTRGCATRSRSAGWGCRPRWWPYTKSGCAPQFALWSFNDLGYLTYYATYLLATDAAEGRGRRDLRGRADGRATRSRNTRPATTACAC